MRFPFRPFDGAPSPAHNSTRIWRPIVPIRVFGPAGMRLAFGSLDTGADETQLPMDMANKLGIEIDAREPAGLRVLSGHQAKGFYGKDVGFELRQGKRSHRWVVPSLACLYEALDATDEDKITITLGHVGFFRFFHVTFDCQRGRVRINPNGLFHHQPG